MKVEIKIPPIGESIVEATISNILHPSGSLVRQDQEILELETEKVNQVLYAPKAGKLSLTIKAGDLVKIGQVIGDIDTDVAETPAKKIEGPSARKMAPEFIAQLKEPAPKKAEIPAAPSGQASRKKMTSLRKTIAQKLVEVKNQTAMLTTFNEVDMTLIIEIRAKEKDPFMERYKVKLGFMSFFIKASAAALKAYPDINSSIEGDEIVNPNTCNIGVAVSTDRGLLVPVIKNCEDLSFGKIEQLLAEFAKKAREGTISMDYLRGGTFTITNGGVFGSLVSTPILNPGQSAILGMHAIVKRPVAMEDQVVIRPMMYLALSYDHRIVDGKEAIQFLVHVKENLEDPARLLLDL